MLSAALEELALQNGYAFERHEVVTEDGYVLKLERIPRRGASRS